MITIELNVVQLSLMLGAALGAGALAAGWRAAHKLRALRKGGLALESRAAAMRRELDRLGAAAAQSQSQARAQEQSLVQTLARLQRVEQQFAAITDRIGLVEFRGEGRSFDQAIDFARRGADPDKLAEKFGLSRGEADLVTRLHRRAARS